MKNGERRHEFKTVHGYRKFFKTHCEQVMKSINVEILMGHTIGVSDCYYKPSEKEILEDYLKAINVLSINNNQKILEKQITELKEKSNDNEYIIKAKLQEKDEQIKIIQSQMNVLVGIISRLDSEEGKNKIAKQLIENGLCTK